jgi:hypothetical protein
MPVLDPHPIRPAINRELYFLQQLAETFQFELELERQLRLQGRAALPIEWSTYLENQRQMILDKIERLQSREERPIPSLGMGNDAHPTQDIPPTPPILVPTVPHTQPEQSIYAFVLPETEGMLAFALIPMSCLTDNHR